MVNKELVEQKLDELDEMGLNDPSINDIWAQLLDALGDDEDDIIEYINSLDDEKAADFDCIYEETVDKFPSDEMEMLFHKKVHKLD